MKKVITLTVLVHLVFIGEKVFAQKGDAMDTMVGKTLVAQMTYKSHDEREYQKVLSYEVKDINTDKPVIIKKGSQWQCIKIDHSKYILSDSGVTISVLPKPTPNFTDKWVTKNSVMMDKGLVCITGFLEKSIVVAKQKMDSIATAASDSERVRKNREYYNGLVKNYGQKSATLIYYGKVDTGFTTEMCIKSWGQPDDITKKEFGNDKFEEWTYGSSPHKNSILFFENGVLTDYQPK